MHRYIIGVFLTVVLLMVFVVLLWFRTGCLSRTRIAHCAVLRLAIRVKLAWPIGSTNHSTHTHIQTSVHFILTTNFFVISYIYSF